MNTMTRRHAMGLLAGTAVVALIPALVLAESGTKITVYKTPWCGCCTGWAQTLRDAGFDVSEEKHEDLAPLKARFGVPEDLEGCHTAEVEGYGIEGHVPAVDIKKLLATRPDALGLAVPGMPMGSPGMGDGSQRDAYDVVLFTKKGRSVFNHYAARG